jgi:hypothetical protein
VVLGGPPDTTAEGRSARRAPSFWGSPEKPPRRQRRQAIRPKPSPHGGRRGKPPRRQEAKASARQHRWLERAGARRMDGARRDRVRTGFGTPRTVERRSNSTLPVAFLAFTGALAALPFASVARRSSRGRLWRLGGFPG